MSESHGTETIADFIHWGQLKLSEGLARESSRLDAEILLASALGCSRTWLYAHSNETVSTSTGTRYQQMIKSRGTGVPLEYLTGRTEFYGLSLYVTTAVLVPRPETEWLVELALRELPTLPEGLVADVGTGSGAISVAIAHAAPGRRVIATDISYEALQVAAHNVQALNLTDRVTLLCCDLLEALILQPVMVIANLPYVTRQELESTSRAVVAHEPRAALDGGANGLELVDLLLADLGSRLKPRSILLEIGAGQGQAALRLANLYFPQAKCEVLPDLAGRERVLRIRN